MRICVMNIIQHCIFHINKTVSSRSTLKKSFILYVLLIWCFDGRSRKSPWWYIMGKRESERGMGKGKKQKREEKKKKKPTLCGLIWWNIHYFVGKKPKWFILQYSMLKSKRMEQKCQCNCMESSVKNSIAKEYFDWDT